MLKENDPISIGDKIDIQVDDADSRDRYGEISICTKELPEALIGCDTRVTFSGYTVQFSSSYHTDINGISSLGICISTKPCANLNHYPANVWKDNKDKVFQILSELNEMTTFDSKKGICFNPKPYWIKSDI